MPGPDRPPDRLGREMHKPGPEVLCTMPGPEVLCKVSPFVFSPSGKVGGEICIKMKSGPCPTKKGL